MPTCGMEKVIMDIERKMELWMVKNWGKRCPEYEESCNLCKAWKCFDFIFDR